MNEYGLPTIETQLNQARRWASHLALAGYITELHGTGFDTEWRIYPTWNATEYYAITIDGCGASWRGSDECYLAWIAPHEH